MLILNLCPVHLKMSLKSAERLSSVVTYKIAGGTH